VSKFYVHYFIEGESWTFPVLKILYLDYFFSFNES